MKLDPPNQLPEIAEGIATKWHVDTPASFIFAKDVAPYGKGNYYFDQGSKVLHIKAGDPAVTMINGLNGMASALCFLNSPFAKVFSSNWADLERVHKAIYPGSDIDLEGRVFVAVYDGEPRFITSNSNEPYLGIEPKDSDYIKKILSTGRFDAVAMVSKDNPLSSIYHNTALTTNRREAVLDGTVQGLGRWLLETINRHAQDETIESYLNGIKDYRNIATLIYKSLCASEQQSGQLIGLRSIGIQPLPTQPYIQGIAKEAGIDSSALAYIEYPAHVEVMCVVPENSDPVRPISIPGGLVIRTLTDSQLKEYAQQKNPLVGDVLINGKVVEGAPFFQEAAGIFSSSAVSPDIPKRLLEKAQHHAGLASQYYTLCLQAEIITRTGLNGRGFEHQEEKRNQSLVESLEQCSQAFKLGAIAHRYLKDSEDSVAISEIIRSPTTLIERSILEVEQLIGASHLDPSELHLPLIQQYIARSQAIMADTQQEAMPTKPLNIPDASKDITGAPNIPEIQKTRSFVSLMGRPAAKEGAGTK